MLLMSYSMVSNKHAEGIIDSQDRGLTVLYFVESALFGVPLSTLLENDQKIKPSTSIPLFLQTVRIISDDLKLAASDPDRPLKLNIRISCHLCNQDVLIRLSKSV